jgi:hypothetical protein
MWDDVIIGNCDRGNMAIKVNHPGNQNISENTNCFWIAKVYLGLGMTIDKNTPEGHHLQTMIEEGIRINYIMEYLSELLIKNVDSRKLMKAIAERLNDEFERGRQNKAAEIRKALEI